MSRLLAVWTIVLILLGMAVCVVVGGWALGQARDNGEVERLNEATAELGASFRSAFEPLLRRLIR